MKKTRLVVLFGVLGLTLGSYALDAQGPVISGNVAISGNVKLTALPQITWKLQDDFTDGNFSQYSSHTSQCVVQNTIVFSSPNAAQCTYSGSNSNDQFFEYGFGTGQLLFTIETEIRIDTPIGGAPDNIQRKLYYIRGPDNPNQVPYYSVVMDTWTFSGTIELVLGLQPCQAPPGACGGAQTLQYFPGATLSHNAFHKIRTGISLGTQIACNQNGAGSIGVANDHWAIWLDDVLVASSTNAQIWCTDSGTAAGIHNVFIGEQADSAGGASVNETREIDNVKIAQAYSGP